MYALLLVSGLVLTQDRPAPDDAQAAPSPRQNAEPADSFVAPAGWKKLGPSLWFDPTQRVLVIRAKVSLREGFLEHLMCSTRTKEHESIVATEAPPRLIHAGLLLTGAEPGHPVRFRPEFEPPTGTPIQIQLEWTDASGAVKRADAREWVRDAKTRKVLEPTWVFAGSQLLERPDTKEKVYLAESGDLVTVSNFVEAILDVPISSSASDEARSFEAATEQIPPIGTPVTITLRPMAQPKADPAAKPEK